MPDEMQDPCLVLTSDTVFATQWSAFVKVRTSSSSMQTLLNFRESINLKVQNGRPWAHVQTTTDGFTNGGGDTTVNDGEWHDVAMTYDGTTIRFYVDGSLDGQFSKSGDVLDDGEIHYGCRLGESEQTQGALADLRIFNAVLSESDVLALSLPTTADQGTNCSLSTHCYTAHADSLRLNAAIPFPHIIDFDGNADGTIVDGGRDMFDGGNIMRTSLCALDDRLAPYTDDFEIATSNCFGSSDAEYRMDMQSSSMVLEATNQASVPMDFIISGNLGADGFGTSTQWGFRAANLQVFGSTVCATADPSVNHMFIINTDSSPNARHVYQNDTNFDTDRITNILPGSAFVYILYSSTAGHCPSLSQHRAIFEASTGCISQCGATPGQYKCECLPGRSGHDCQEDLDECALDAPCENEAACTDSHDDDSIGLGEFACACTEGWEGHTCSEDLDECLSSPCLNGATCADFHPESRDVSGQVYNCSCAWGYDGEHCAGYVNVCETGENDCVEPVLDAPGFSGILINLSFCTTLGPGQHECGCVTGYYGDGRAGDLAGQIDGVPGGCVDVDECASNPCANGATCTDSSSSDFELLDGYSCSCAAGYANGVCEYDFISEYTANCTVEPHTQTGNCDVDVDECASSPCANNASCYVTGNVPVDAYACNCTVGYISGMCDEDILGRPKLVHDCNTMNGNCDVDYDECEVDHGGCDFLTECINTDGNFTCGPCPASYLGNSDSRVSNEGCYRTCDPIYLGANVGWVNVFDWYDGDESCQLNMDELDSVCEDYYEECLEFMNEDECEPLYLGVHVGYVNVFEWSDTDGSCKLDVAELDAVCVQYRDECCQFISDVPGTCAEAVPEPEPEEVEQPEPERTCSPMFLGNDIGWVNVFAYSDADGDCRLNLAEMVEVCASFYEECLAFIYGQVTPPALEDACSPVYLGEDVGYVDVYSYFDNGDCTMDADEIAAICEVYEEQCLSFIGADHDPPACDPIYLGENLGWTDVISFYDDGDCILETEEILAMCEDMEEVCRQFLDGPSDCDPIFLGDGVGWVEVFMNYTTNECTVDMTTLEAMCAGDTAACAAFGSFNDCVPTYLGRGIGWAQVLILDPATDSCVADLNELSILCAHQSEQCLAFLAADECEPVLVTAGDDEFGFQNVFEFDSDVGLCVLDPGELAAVCGDSYDLCRQALALEGCPPGWYDDDGDVSTACLACSAGQFAPARATECSPCEAGFADTDHNPATPCQQCADHFESTEGSTDCTTSSNWCPAVDLGPHIGTVHVHDWDPELEECYIDDDRLVATCGQHYVECLAFLDSAELDCPTPMYLGEEVGWVNIHTWNVTSLRCEVNLDQVVAMCNGYVAECLAYLHAADTPDSCAPNYLGENVGWAVVQTNEESDDGSCEIDDQLLLATCGEYADECADALGAEGSGRVQSHDCPPTYFGDEVGFVNVMAYNSTTAVCEVVPEVLSAICNQSGVLEAVAELEMGNPCLAGCTDPIAFNYNPSATFSLPGCEYPCSGVEDCEACGTEVYCDAPQVTDNKCRWDPDSETCQVRDRPATSFISIAAPRVIATGARILTLTLPVGVRACRLPSRSMATSSPHLVSATTPARPTWMSTPTLYWTAWSRSTVLAGSSLLSPTPGLTASKSGGPLRRTAPAAETAGATAGSQTRGATVHSLPPISCWRRTRSSS